MRIGYNTVLKIYTYQNKKCYYCNNDMENIIKNGGNISIDHKLPSSKGGSNDILNLCLCCPKCNNKKGNSLSYNPYYKEYLKHNPTHKLKTYIKKIKFGIKQFIYRLLIKLFR